MEETLEKNNTDDRYFKSYEYSSHQLYSLGKTYIGFVGFYLFCIIGLIYATIVVANKELVSLFKDSYLVFTVIYLILLVIYAFALIIFNCMFKSRLSIVNDKFSKLWRIELIRLIVGALFNIIGGIVGGTVGRGIRGANSIYQFIEAYRIRKYFIYGVDQELARIGKVSTDRDSLIMKSFFVTRVLSLVLIFAGGIFISLSELNGFNTARFYSIGLIFIMGSMLVLAVDYFLVARYIFVAKDKLLNASRELKK